MFAVPLVLFVALAATFVLVLRRAARVMAGTRELDAFRRSTADLAARIDVSLTGVAGRIDGVRRHQLDPDAIAENLDAAEDAIARYLEEAEAMRPPADVAGLRVTLAEELARTARALDMVRHGCDALATGVAGPRELEGQTAVKRGYLNVLHARDAIRRVAADAQRARLPRRSGRVVPTSGRIDEPHHNA